MKKLKEEPYWYFDKVTIPQQRAIYQMSKKLGIKMLNPKTKREACLIIDEMIIKLKDLCK